MEYYKSYDTDSNYSNSNFLDLENNTIKLIKSLQIIRQIPIGNEIKRSTVKNVKKQILDSWYNSNIFIQYGVTRDILSSLAENYDKMYGTDYYSKLFENDDNYSTDS